MRKNGKSQYIEELWNLNTSKLIGNVFNCDINKTVLFYIVLAGYVGFLPKHKYFCKVFFKHSQRTEDVRESESFVFTLS